MFENGLGVKKNKEQAIKYYNEAVKQGHITARARLASLAANKSIFGRIVSWVKTRLLIARLIKEDPTIKTKNHPRLGISTSINLK